jgi:hypothetical protein
VELEKLEPVGGQVLLSSCEVPLDPEKTMNAGMATLARLVAALNHAFTGDASAYLRSGPSPRRSGRFSFGYETVVSTRAPVAGRALQ